VCDAKDRVWIAYEEGDEQWGKDYSIGQWKKGGLPQPPGNPLYLKRTVRVKCLVDDKLRQPGADLPKALATGLGNSKSLPRLVVDDSGGLWMLLRHHPFPTGQGEVWYSYAMRYDGKTWTPPRRLASSSNLLDNRPALVPYGQGILTVYSSDNRIN